MYAAANDILGNVVKVTPSSKVVGDLALHLVAVGADPKEFEEKPGKFDIPDSVIGFLNGELGDPPGGWPEPFRKKALEGRKWKEPVGELTDEQASGLEGTARRQTLNDCSSPARRSPSTRPSQTYGDVSVLDTADYLYGLQSGTEHVVEIEEGKRLILGLQAISEADERGYRSVMCTINGQLRPVNVRDESVESDVAAQEKADPKDDSQVAAPFDGVVTLAGRGGRLGRGRRDSRHDRGDEDGGLDHRPEGRQGRTPRLHRHPAGRRRRPRPRIG